MKKITLITILCTFAFSSIINAQDTLIIQEDTIPIGICTMDGTLDSDGSGWTGQGYANIDNGEGIGMSWSILVDTTGDYQLAWRYALGGADTLSRNGQLLIDYIVVDTVLFPHTAWPNTDWSQWEMTQTHTIHLDSGQYTISLSSITHKGLANLDYFRIIGPARDSITPMGNCVPAYTFSMNKNIAEAGNISYEPVQSYYLTGTEITVRASANPGYFFHSFSGEAAGTDTVFTFEILENTQITALFYPDTVPDMDPNAMGYATVQHNNGTPYLLIGGALGDTVNAQTLADLESYLGDNTPRVVILNQHIFGTTEITVGSNKTLIGTDGAHLEGIKLGINNARNVIIKNITISKVLAADEIEINGGLNIWIDHCELFTDRDHDHLEDYYDGLIDIKNSARFITISNCHLHDHSKTSLISSGDQEVPDTVIRATYYNNYFENCNSRLPSIRFGKAHIINNYYKDCNSAINSRMGACVRVERNYFENVGTAVMMVYSEYGGSVELIDNHFGGAGVTETPTCELNLPYDYDDFLIDVDQVPTVIPTVAGIDTNIKFNIPVGITPITIPSNYELFSFPNPVKNSVTILFNLPESIIGSLTIIDMVGHTVKKIDQHDFHAGVNRIEVNVSDLKDGIYLYQLNTKEGYGLNRLVIQR